MAKIERTKHDIYPFISPLHSLQGAAAGKTVLVTGGGKGLGKNIAMNFALAGAKTIIVSGRTESTLHDAKTEIEAAAPNTKVQPVSMDVSVEASVEALFDGLDGPPDILVNNAAALAGNGRIVDTDPTTWWHDWEINIKGTYLCTRKYLLMLAGKPGIILNVSSAASDVVPGWGWSSYGTCKQAMNRLTEFVHVEHGKEGVRCIAFHPASFADSDLASFAPPELRARLNDTAAIAGGTALYLSTPRAAFLDGRFVYANWDMEQVESIKDEIVSKDLLVSRVQYGDRMDKAFML